LFEEASGAEDALAFIDAVAARQAPPIERVRGGRITVRTAAVVESAPREPRPSAPEAPGIDVAI